MPAPDEHTGPLRSDDAVYGLEEPSLPRPALPGEVVVAEAMDGLIDRLAADLVVHAENCVREFGDFHLALSGGSVFEPLFARLMYDPDCRRLPWRRTHLWFVEERCVPFDDPRSSYRRVNEFIGDHADIPSEQFHPMFANAPTVVADYQALIREALGWREKGQDRLDYVLLALDERGATAGATSNGIYGEPAAFVERCAGEPDRISLSYAFINASRFVAVLVSGAAHAPVVRQLADPEIDAAFPVRALAPINGELRWYLDGPACGVDDS